MANILSILGMGATAKAKADTAALEGQDIAQKKAQANLLLQLKQEQDAAQRASDEQYRQVQTQNILDQIRQRNEAPAAPARRTQVVDGQLVDLDAGTASAIQGYQAPAPKRTPERGTPEYIAMLEAEAAARAKGGGGERGATLPAAAIEKMIDLDDLIAQASRASKSLSGAVNSGKNVTGRVAGFIPVPNAVRDIFKQGGDEGVSARSDLANIASSIMKLRSGAAVSDQEFARLEPFLPSPNDDESLAMIKLRKLRVALADLKRIRLENYQRYGKPGAGQLRGTDPDSGLDLDALIDAELGKAP